MKKLFKLQPAFIFLLLSLLVTSAAMAAPGLRIERDEPDFSTSLYRELITDIEVKAPGGFIRHQRLLRHGWYWQMDPEWSDLYLVYSTSGTNTFNAGVSTTSASGSTCSIDCDASGSISNNAATETEQGVIEIKRNQYSYVLNGNSTYVYNEHRQIIKTDSGYRWQDRMGNFIDYNKQGRIERTGDQNNVTINFEHNAEGLIERVKDDNGRVVFTYSYDADNHLQSVTDVAGRTVAYTWQTSPNPEYKHLININDVLGHDWQYRYDSKGLISERESPNGHIRNIIHSTKIVEGYSYSPFVCLDLIEGNLTYDGGWQNNGAKCLSQTAAPSDTDAANKLLDIDSTDPTPIWNKGLAGSIVLSGLEDNIGVEKKYTHQYKASPLSFGMTVTDGEGGRIQRKYNARGLLTQTISNGRVTSYEVKEGSTTTIDENGNATKVIFNQWRQPTKTIYADGSFTTTEYHPNFNFPTKEVDENGNITTYEYDVNGQVIRQIKGAGSTAEQKVEMEYNQDGKVTSIKRFEDSVLYSTFTYSYDEYSNLLDVTDGEGHKTRYQNYSVLGKAQTMIDARGNTWAMTYDAAGNLLTSTSPLAQKTTYTYDKMGNQVQIKNQLGFISTFSFDVRNRLASITSPLNERSRFEYDNKNQMIAQIDPLGRTTRLHYDLDGRLVQTIDSDNYSTYQDYGYTHLKGYLPTPRNPSSTGDNSNTVLTGNTTIPPRTIDFPSSQNGSQITGVAGVLNNLYYPSYTESNGYDSRYRLISATRTSLGLDNQVMRYQYDKKGNRIKNIDALNRETDYQYDALDRMISMKDPLNNFTRYTYDDQSNLVNVNNAKGIDTWRYRYDKNNRLLESLRPGDASYNYQYDPIGNLIQYTDAKGQVVKRTYDAHNNLVKNEYFENAQATEASKTVVFTYDAIDRPAGYNDGVTSAIYQHDNVGRLSSHTIDFGPFSKTVTQTYNAASQLTSRTQDSITTTYRYDNQTGKLTGISIPEEGELTYNQYYWTLPSQQTLPGGGQLTTQYDGYLRNTSYAYQTAGNDSNVIAYQAQLSYNVVNQLIGQTLSDQSGEQSIDYQYDNLDRLIQSDTEENNVTDTNAYTLDPVHNRLTENGSATWEYDDRDQLITRGTISYQYDANGGRIEEIDSENEQNNKTYIYNLENRLSEIKSSTNQIIATYYYSPEQQRLSKTVNGETIYFLYAEEGLIGEYDQTGNAVRQYIYEPQSDYGTKPVAMQRNSQWGYYRLDHLGTPELIVNKSGRTLWQAEYGDFGETNILIEEVVNPLRFPGQYYDQETSLHYNWHRYYETTSGRYITSDPIGLNGGINVFLYANANPLLFIDFDGRAVQIPIRAMMIKFKALLIACGKNKKCRCQVTHGSYKFACDEGLGACDGNDSCFENTAKTVEASACYGLRAAYIRMGCDKIIPSPKTDHPREAKNALNRISKCVKLRRHCCKKNYKDKFL